MIMPVMTTTLNGWMQDITLIKIAQAVDANGIVSDTETLLSFTGTIQPLQGEQLNAKPMDMRSYRWLQIHTPDGQVISTGDEIQYNLINYRVTEMLDYEINGFFEYHCVEQRA